MAKGLFGNARTFVKNMTFHLGLVLRRKARRIGAWAAIRRDWRKLRRSTKRAQTGAAHKNAVHLVKKGRERYNARDYEGAESYFRDALTEDPRYALAHTYLGHSLYKQGHIRQAVAAWRRAVAAEPGSEAATKAQRKIRYVQKTHADYVSILEDPTRDRTT